MKRAVRNSLRDVVIILATSLTTLAAVIMNLGGNGEINWSLPAVAAAMMTAVPIGVRAFIHYSRMLSRRRCDDENDPHSATPLALLLIAIGLVIAASGCAFNGSVRSHFQEEIQDGATVNRYVYDAVSKAGLAGQIDTSIHRLDYAWGDTANHLAIGQDAHAIDNTRQSEIVLGIMQEVARLINVIIQMYSAK